MNRYLMSIEHSFMGVAEFEVNATDEEDALFVGKQFFKRNFLYPETYYLETLKVVKKLRKKKGES